MKSVAKKSRQFSECRVERRCLVSHGSLNMVTGDFQEGKKEWESGPCRGPLFEADTREIGICRSCLRGWVHPGNYPTEVGVELLKQHGVKIDLPVLS